jgi:hypothetical protein
MNNLPVLVLAEPQPTMPWLRSQAAKCERAPSKFSIQDVNRTLAAGKHFRKNNTMNTPPKLELMSMEQLSRLARNQGEDKALRHQALEMLNRRERRYFGHCYPGDVSRVYNYASGL